jgi:hypothetical protein
MNTFARTISRADVGAQHGHSVNVALTAVLLVLIAAAVAAIALTGRRHEAPMSGREERREARPGDRSSALD